MVMQSLDKLRLDAECIIEQEFFLMQSSILFKVGQMIVTPAYPIYSAK